jgi:hypothetical protein
MDPEEQTPEPVVQDPTPTPPAEPEITGPWANDLAKHFEDPAQRAAVDAFLRETVQPYSTKLEQQLAGLKPAQQLYEDFVANPNETFIAIAEELYQEDGAKAIQDQLTALFGEQEDTVVTDTPETPPALDPEDKAAVEWAKQQAIQQQYNAEFERVKGLDEYKDIPAEDWELFHPFVASAEGDFDAAAAGFNQWRAQVESRYKPADPDPEPDPEAPVTLDSTTPPAPPVAKDYKNIDDAIEDWFAEERPQAPPVVGSV